MISPWQKQQQSNEDIGETKFVWTWKGFDIYLDHRVCTAITQAEDMTAAIAAFVSQIMPVTAPVTGTIAAILELGSIIYKQQDLGRGIIIAVETLTGVPIPHWVSSQ